MCLASDAAQAGVEVVVVVLVVAAAAAAVAMDIDVIDRDILWYLYLVK